METTPETYSTLRNGGRGESFVRESEPPNKTQAGPEIGEFLLLGRDHLVGNSG